METLKTTAISNWDMEMCLLFLKTHETNQKLGNPLGPKTKLKNAKKAVSERLQALIEERRCQPRACLVDFLAAIINDQLQILEHVLEGFYCRPVLRLDPNEFHSQLEQVLAYATLRAAEVESALRRMPRCIQTEISQDQQANSDTSAAAASSLSSNHQTSNDNSKTMPGDNNNL